MITPSLQKGLGHFTFNKGEETNASSKQSFLRAAIA